MTNHLESRPRKMLVLGAIALSALSLSATPAFAQPGTAGGSSSGGYGEGGEGDGGGYGAAGMGPRTDSGYGGSYGGASYGGDSYGGEGGGYIGGEYREYGGGEYGGDGYPTPPKRVAISGDGMKQPGIGGTATAARPGTGIIHAERIVAFRYKMGTLRPTRVQLYNSDMGGMGGMGMGPGMGGPGMGEASGMDMGMGGGGYGGGMDMGMGGGGYGGDMDGGYGGAPGGRKASKTLLIYAFVGNADSNAEKQDGGGSSEQKKASREQIHLAIRASKEDRRNYDKRTSSKLPLYEQFETAIRKRLSGGSKTQTEELALVGRMIRQTVWKDSAIALISDAGQTPPAGSEELLGQILGEEYDTQIARQEFEIAGIESRIKRLRDEVAKRKAAKQRVVDVKLGRIVLEAQGLLQP